MGMRDLSIPGRAALSSRPITFGIQGHPVLTSMLAPEAEAVTSLSGPSTGDKVSVSHARFAFDKSTHIP